MLTLDNDDSFGKYATAVESDSGLDPTFQQLMKHGREEGDADAGYDDLMALMQELKASKPKRVYPYTQGQYARGRRSACMYTLCTHGNVLLNCTEILWEICSGKSIGICIQMLLFSGYGKGSGVTVLYMPYKMCPQRRARSYVHAIMPLC